ncbi:MAG: Mrp/NBP35 family ATP-binding protein [Lachnospiraceae bacterium]|nr:Mrp/NBP35 family ATP-binding protein [Lachnospiraceae bacterium]
MAKECSNSDCSQESCEGCSQRPVDFRVAPNEFTRVKHVIGVVSGKGGVGKSTVTAGLAVALNRQGFRVGILDADITGPSIPRMFGVTALGGLEGEQWMIPAESETGIEIVSLNLLMEDKEAPVIWRGPVIAGALKQFSSDVILGDLDYLLVDMPPGTGEEPLTVFQSLPVDGILLVTSPQGLVEMVVRKAWHMAEQMNIPILGVIENFSYVLCPDCGRKIHVFGESHLEAWSQETGTLISARKPLPPEEAELADTGRMEMIPALDFDGITAVLPR